MNVFQRVAQWVAEKLYSVGPARVQQSDQSWGVDPTTFQPTSHGNYYAKSPAIYACSKYRADNIAQLPPKLFKLRPDGEREERTDGALFELLRRPNPWWTWARLIHMTELSLSLWGSAFIVKERGVTPGKPATFGPVRELWWARPDRMRVVPHQNDYVQGFIYQEGIDEIVFPPENIIWLRYPNPLDQFSGISPVQSAKVTADMGEGALESNKHIFDQGIQAGGVISPVDNETTWREEQMTALRQKMRDQAKGSKNAHRVLILQRAARFTNLTMTPKDAEFTQVMKWTRGTIAMVYGIPPELIGDHDHATYSNINQAYKGVWTDTLQPEASFLGEEMTTQLVPEFPNEADVLELFTGDVAALKEDMDEVTEQARKWFAMGVPLNRLLEEYNPRLLPSGGGGYAWGEDAWLPVNLMPTTGDEERPPVDDGDVPAPTALPEAAGLLKRIAGEWQEYKALPAPTPRNVVELDSDEHVRLTKRFDRRTARQMGLVRRTMRRLFEGQEQAVLARLNDSENLSFEVGGEVGLEDGATRIKSADDVAEEPFPMARWSKRFKDEMRPVLTAILEDAGAEVLDDLAVGISFDVDDPRAVRWLENRSQRFARQVNKTTWNALRESLAEGMRDGDSIPDLAKRVRAIFADASKKRAVVIARTEVIPASNEGAMEAARQSGVVESKGWLASLDGRERATHREAHKRYQSDPIPLDEDFRVGGYSGPAPGQIGVGKEDVQCRCTVTFTVKRAEERSNGVEINGNYYSSTIPAGGIVLDVDRN